LTFEARESTFGVVEEDETDVEEEEIDSDEMDVDAVVPVDAAEVDAVKVLVTGEDRGNVGAATLGSSFRTSLSG